MKVKIELGSESEVTYEAGRQKGAFMLKTDIFIRKRNQFGTLLITTKKPFYEALQLVFSQRSLGGDLALYKIGKTDIPLCIVSLEKVFGYVPENLYIA